MFQSPNSSVKVVIAAIDRSSIMEFGPWPWPKARMAKLLEILNGYYEASAIGIAINITRTGSNLNKGSERIIKETIEKFSDFGFSETKKADSFIKYLEKKRKNLIGDDRLRDALNAAQNTVLGFYVGFSDRFQSLSGSEIFIHDEIDKSNFSEELSLKSFVSFIRFSNGFNRV